MDMMELAARGQLLSDQVGNIDMLDVLDRGAGSVIIADGRGVLLTDRLSGACMMISTTPAAAESLAAFIPEVPYMVVHEDFAVPILTRRLPLELQLECHQAVHLRGPMPVSPRPDLRLAPLGPEWAVRLTQHYTLDLGPEHMRNRCAAGAMLGAFDGDDLAGFIGEHAEGSMGMLEVLPAYRRRGIASHLVAVLANRYLAAGRLPYAQITTSNTASESLFRGLGFTFSPHKLYWLNAR